MPSLSIRPLVIALRYSIAIPAIHWHRYIFPVALIIPTTVLPFTNARARQNIIFQAMDASS